MPKRLLPGKRFPMPNRLLTKRLPNPDRLLRPKRLRLPKPLLLGLSLWMAACSLIAPKFEKPNLSVVSIEMMGGNFLQQNFLVKLNIQNPNDRTLPVTSLHAELNVGGERIASGVSNRAFVVPAFGETQFDMTITANMAAALVQLLGRNGKQSQSIEYDMTGGANIDLPFFRDLPFHQHGSFPLPVL